MKLQKALIATVAAVFAFSFAVGEADAKNGRKDHHWYDHKHKHHRSCDHDDDYRDHYRYRDRDRSHHYRRVYVPRQDVVFFNGYPYHRSSRERLTVIYDGRGFVLGYTFRNDYDDRRYRNYYGDRYSYRF